MQKVDNIPLEHVQNYVKLQNLLNCIALPVLRKIFSDNWKIKSESEWINSEIQGTEFISDIGANLFKDARKIQKNLLKTGDIEKWDVPLIIDAIKCFECSQVQHQSFNNLKDVRNQLSHHGGLEIDNELFDKMWSSISDALITLGITQSDLDKAKYVSVQENKENIKKAEDLRVEGNLHVKNKNFELAVSKYSEAILQPGLPSKELAILYSNRSFAYLKLGNYYGAKYDAMGASLLNSNWWRGFARLGYAYLSVDKYERALVNFETAIALDPKCKLQNERDYCRHMIEKLNREEHLDPINHITSYEELASKLNDKHQRSPIPLHVLSTLTGQLDLKHKPSGMCAEGHKYLHGTGVEQNYQTAAHWFAKAAAEGNAEGYYNLAILSKEGKGVHLNVEECIRLLHLAAAQDISKKILGWKIPNIGVVEAEHSLGLCYQDGVGVPQDFKKALEWYTRAIKHGSGISANNVGFMYDNGVGVRRNLLTALNYYKLGASRKIVRAMENVATVYLHLFDKDNARKWFKFAISNGSLALQSKKQFYIALVGDELDDPIEEDVFELELIDEVKAGPLAHLIVEDLPLTHEEMDRVMNSGMKNVNSTATTSRFFLGLTDPYRVLLIKNHRGELRTQRNQTNEFTKGEGNLLPKPLVDLFALKPVYFADMDPKTDRIYEGFAIKLTLIEDAITGKPSIRQLAEDESGDAQRIFVYNFPQNEETQNKLGFGCKITIVNPYFRLAKDGKPMIRVDDVSLMFFHSSTTNTKRCRYCGNESDHTVPCRQCKRCFYCSKICLEKDATELNHKDVCLKLL